MNAVDWMDVARDIANFMLQYLPEYTEQAVGEPYTTELPCLRVPSPDWLCLQAPSTRKPYTGGPWRGRHIISVGHSIGAASSVSACSLLPAGLVNGLVLFDPTVQPLDLGAVDRVMPLVYGALMRRDSWKTKQEALDGFAKKKQFFGRWNAEALASYAENGLYETSSKHVTLKARKHDEAVSTLLSFVTLSSSLT